MLDLQITFTIPQENTYHFRLTDNILDIITNSQKLVNDFGVFSSEHFRFAFHSVSGIVGGKNFSRNLIIQSADTELSRCWPLFMFIVYCLEGLNILSLLKICHLLARRVEIQCQQHLQVTEAILFYLFVLVLSSPLTFTSYLCSSQHCSILTPSSVSVLKGDAV